VKYCISILAAAAILVLGATAAFGAGTSVPWDTNSGPRPGGDRINSTQNISKTVAPATQIATLKAKIRSLTAQNRALAAQAKWQADRNASLNAYIDVLSKRIADLGGGPVIVPAVVDPDQECKDYSVCTPEQECRIYRMNCPVVPPATPTVDAMPENGSQAA
jgi:hypothetical protein